MTTDEAGTIQSWSLRGEQEFGYAYDQAVGRLTIHDLLVDHPTEGTWDVSGEFETPARRAHGPDGLVKVRVQIVERDSRSYRIYVLQDVSAQAEIRMQRAVLDRQLQHAVKLEGLGVLAGGIAHDFNSILTSLFGNISLAKMELPTDHRAWSYLTDAESSMTRATHLSGQLLTFAKGGQPMREAVHLGPLLGEIVRFDLSGSNVLPVVRAQEGLWAADVDKGQVHQVFSNLTLNARQSMPDGGHLRFTLQNADVQDDTLLGLAPGRYVRVVVRDEGIGIEPKHLDQIYDPFFSTKESGRGLGLATTYSIVHKHAGQIGVESTPGEGTAFTVYLPASASIPRPERGDTASPRPAAARAGRVLLMDDDDMVCKIATGMLQTIGFAVEAVSDGDQAVERYKQEVEAGRLFDVAILDLTIPGGKGGKDAVGDILACDPRATVIVSSGYADDPVLANYADYCFKGVVPKPYTLQQLDAALRGVL